MSLFDAETFMPRRILGRITDARVAAPGLALSTAQQRLRREQLTWDGRLALLAADHPGRGVTAVGDDPLRMADRHDFLARIVRVVAAGAVDGVMATMDVLEDLLILHALMREAGGPGLVDDVLLIPSLNRGGLAGAVWELDDPMTGPSPEACVRWGMDGVKLLLRLDERQPDSLRTLVACADAVSRATEADLPVFLEPLPVVQRDGRVVVSKEAAALTRLVGIAAALGESSHRLWLKLPYCDGFAQVAAATTLPIVLLGGPATGNAGTLVQDVAAGLEAGANVRGTLVGRNVLYPGDADPAAAAGAISGLVHEGWTVAQAQDLMHSPGEAMDAVTRWLS